MKPSDFGTFQLVQHCRPLSILASLRILGQVQGLGLDLQGTQWPGPSISKDLLRFEGKDHRWQVHFSDKMELSTIKVKLILWRRQSFLRGLSKTMEWAPKGNKDHHKHHHLLLQVKGVLLRPDLVNIKIQISLHFQKKKKSLKQTLTKILYYTHSSPSEEMMREREQTICDWY